MNEYSTELRNLAADVQVLREEVETARKSLIKANHDSAKLTLMLDTKNTELAALKDEYTANIKIMRDEHDRVELELDGEKHRWRLANDELVNTLSKAQVLEEKLKVAEADKVAMQMQITVLKNKVQKQAEDGGNSTLFHATKRAFAEASTYQDELQDIADSYKKRNEEDERKILQLTMQLQERGKELEDLQTDYDQLFGRYRREADKLKQLRAFYNSSTEDIRNIRGKSPAVSIANFEQLNLEEKGKPAMVATHGTKREIKAKDFPKKNSKATFSDYYTAMKNYVSHLKAVGHEDGIIAEELFQALSQGELNSVFLHQYNKLKKVEVPDTTEFLLDTLSKVDFEFCHLTAEDRFKAIRMERDEKLSTYLQRCEQGYDATFPQQTSAATRFFEIKKRFIEGSGFPIYQQERLLPFSNLKELLFGAETISRHDNRNRRFQQR